MNIKEYVYNSSPQTFNPDLANLIGLQEAIIFQQIIYWCKINKEANRNFYEGHYWCYNSYKEWQSSNFKYFSESTIKRAIINLEKMGLLISGNFNKLKIDNTKWYRPNLEFNFDQPSGQIDPTTEPNHAVPSGQIDPTITRDYPETIPEITNNTQAKPETVSHETNLTNDLKELFDKANINLTGKKLSWAGKEKEYGRNLQLIIKAAEGDFEEIKKRAAKFFKLVRDDDWYKKQGFTPSSFLSTYNKLGDINPKAEIEEEKKQMTYDELKANYSTMDPVEFQRQMKNIGKVNR